MSKRERLEKQSVDYTKKINIQASEYDNYIKILNSRTQNGTATYDNNFSTHSNKYVSGSTGYPITGGAIWQQPITKQDLEIEKIKKTVFALAKLLSVVFDKDEECETRCGECVSCLISEALGELTKEQMEALAKDDFPANVNREWTKSANTNRYTYTTTTNTF